MNLVEIINSWAISFNPTETQKQKAIERLEICYGCDRLKTKKVFSKVINICGECSCPLSKKVFSPEHNPCPLKKWEEIDTKFGSISRIKKTEKTIL